jgi:hypothetical protein
MTQFALVKLRPGARESKGRHLGSFLSERIFSRALPHVFFEPDGVFALNPWGCAFDEIYLAAQQSIAGGANAGDTALFKALDDLHPDVDSMALWYGEDFVGLPSVSRWLDLYSVLRRDLQGGSLETYVVYSRTAPA